MSTIQALRDVSVSVLTNIRDWVSHPVQVFGDTFLTPTPTMTVATPPCAYPTPYVWSREFLEESGFNLTERIPALLGVHEIPGVIYHDNFPSRRIASAIPPELIHELSLHWTFTAIRGIYNSLVDTISSLDRSDFAWLLFLGLVFVLLYVCRSKLLPILSQVWKELEDDVAAFCHRHFSSAPKEPHPSVELPPGTMLINAEDVRNLDTLADAIQRRINRLRMSKVNFVRSRTGIVFNVNTSRILQIQLTKAQEASRKVAAKKAKPTINFVRSRRAGVVQRLHTPDKLQKQLMEVRKALEEEKAKHQETKDALTLVRELRESDRRLEEMMDEVDEQPESFESAFWDHDTMPVVAETSSDDDEEVKELEAEQARLRAERAEIEREEELRVQRLRAAYTPTSPYVPSANPARPISPIFLQASSERTPAPKAAGPGQVKNSHVQMLNQEVKRLDWRRRSGMPDSGVDGVAAPDDVVDDMFDRQVSQVQNLAPIRFARGSMWGALNDVPTPSSTNEVDRATGGGVGHEVPEMQEEPVGTANNAATQETSSHDSSGELEVAEESENEAWSEVEDEDHKEAKKDDGALMLGRYKVTRPPKEGEDDAMSMLGKHEVTRGEEPASSDTGAPGAEEEAGADESSGDVKDGQEGEDVDGEEGEDQEGVEGEGDQEGVEGEGDREMVEGGEDQERVKGEGDGEGVEEGEDQEEVEGEGDRKAVEEGEDEREADKQHEQGENDHQETPKAEESHTNESQPLSPYPAPEQGPSQQAATTSVVVPQPRFPAQEPSPPAADATDASSPAAQAQTHNESNAGAAQHGQLRRRRPSNFLPGEENATKTHGEEVGDAFPGFVRANATKALSASMWAPKPNTKARATCQQAGAEASPRAPDQPGDAAGPSADAAAVAGPQDHPGSAQSNNHETSVGLDNPDTTPRVRIPPVTPATRAPMHGTPNAGLNTQAAPFDPHGRGRGGRGAHESRYPPTRASAPVPTRSPINSSAASDSFQRMQERFARTAALAPQPPAPAPYPPAPAPQPPAPAPQPPALAPTGPRNPGAGNGNQTPGFVGRGRGNGRGRGGRGRGGPATAAAHAPRQSQAAREVFQRLEARIARAAREQREMGGDHQEQRPRDVGDDGREMR